MKKIIYLFAITLLVFTANLSFSQNNSSDQQKPKDVVLMLKNVSGEYATITEICNGELITNNIEITVISFDVTLFVNGDLCTVPNTDNKISERQATLIRKQKAGDKVFFENIKCKNKLGEERFLPSLVFKIKD